MSCHTRNPNKRSRESVPVVRAEILQLHFQFHSCFGKELLGFQGVRVAILVSESDQRVHRLKQSEMVDGGHKKLSWQFPQKLGSDALGLRFGWDLRNPQHLFSEFLWHIPTEIRQSHDKRVVVGIIALRVIRSRCICHYHPSDKSLKD